MISIAYVVEKGGDGKTTFTLAHGYHLEKEKPKAKTVIVDIDAQGNSTKSLQSKNVLSVTASDLYRKDNIEAIELVEGINLIPATRALLDVDRMPMDQIKRFKKNLNSALVNADYVIIDCPPSLQYRVLAALMAVNHVVSPVTLAGFSLDGVENLLKTIFTVKKKFNNSLNYIGMILNKFDARSNYDKGLAKDILKAFPNYVIRQAVGVRISIKEAAGQQTPVWEMKNNKGAEKASSEIINVLTLIQNQLDGVKQ